MYNPEEDNKQYQNVGVEVNCVFLNIWPKHDNTPFNNKNNINHEFATQSLYPMPDNCRITKIHIQGI